MRWRAQDDVRVAGSLAALGASKKNETQKSNLIVSLRLVCRSIQKSSWRCWTAETLPSEKVKFLLYFGTLKPKCRPTWNIEIVALCYEKNTNCKYCHTVCIIFLAVWRLNPWVTKLQRKININNWSLMPIDLSLEFCDSRTHSSKSKRNNACSVAIFCIHYAKFLCRTTCRPIWQQQQKITNKKYDMLNVFICTWHTVIKKNDFKKKIIARAKELNSTSYFRYSDVYNYAVKSYYELIPYNVCHLIAYCQNVDVIFRRLLRQ